MKKILFYIACVFLFFLITFSIFPSLLTEFSAIMQNSDAVLQAPNSIYFAGTDSLGRDMMARLLDGAKISLIISFGSAFLALLIGITWGLIAGLGGDIADGVLMRIVDVLYSVPDLLFYILLGLFLGRDVFGIIIALCSLSWLSIARLVRQEAKKYKNQDFVMAARAMGQKPTIIAVKHILPQMRESLFIAIIFKIPFIIILESTLSFIGLGLKPPFASFGTLAKEGFDAYLFYPHLIIYPFLFVFITVFSFYSIGNYLKAEKKVVIS